MFLSFLHVLLYALVVLIAVILVVLILIQPSKGDGFGSAFGGVGESVFGAHAMGHLSKLTVWFISLFFIVTLLLAVISGHIRSAGSGKDSKVLGSQAASSAATALPPAPAVDVVPTVDEVITEAAAEEVVAPAPIAPAGDTIPEASDIPSKTDKDAVPAE